MVRNDIDICHLKKGGDRVLFHKHIFKNKLLAIEELKKKNLGPGEIAVARFYVNYKDDYIGGNPSYDGIRMIMAIGGASPCNGNDTYFFVDSLEVGDGNEYLTKEELDEILLNYYTKEEVDNLISSINIPEIDESKFATKEEVEEISLILDDKVDASYVENYFAENVENTVNQIIKDADIESTVKSEIEKQNISQQVKDSVEEELKDLDIDIDGGVEETWSIL